MKKSILFILFLLCFCYSVFGQIRVSGRVVDENGEPLPSATVQIKGTNRGTVTNMEGDFTILVDSEDDILVFRFVGYTVKEIIVSDFESKLDVILIPSSISMGCYFIPTPLKVNYWSGIFYNPYGISVSKIWAYSLPIDYLELDFGYSTNLKNNSDFYGKLETKIFKRYISYKFQQTTFNKFEIENRITTHLVESSSYLRFIKTNLLYGVSYQTFSKKGIEDNESNNYGITLGLLKYISLAELNISAKSFYWQDYWAWEANLNKEFYYKKIRLNTAISYRQTTQEFKEINLTLGYIF